eukprot:scaffold23058_cov68-Phaeocystis_antarctica.AAC.14
MGSVANRARPRIAPLVTTRLECMRRPPAVAQATSASAGASGTGASGIIGSDVCGVRGKRELSLPRRRVRFRLYRVAHSDNSIDRWARHAFAEEQYVQQHGSGGHRIHARVTLGGAGRRALRDPQGLWSSSHAHSQARRVLEPAAGAAQEGEDAEGEPSQRDQVPDGALQPPHPTGTRPLQQAVCRGVAHQDGPSTTAVAARDRGGLAYSGE